MLASGRENKSFIIELLPVSEKVGGSVEIVP